MDGRTFAWGKCGLSRLGLTLGSEEGSELPASEQQERSDGLLDEAIAVDGAVWMPTPVEALPASIPFRVPHLELPSTLYFYPLDHTVTSLPSCAYTQQQHHYHHNHHHHALSLFSIPHRPLA